MNAPAQREVHEFAAETQDENELADALDRGGSAMPQEGWIIAALIAIAVLNALRLILT